jgi:hypothetical protein
MKKMWCWRCQREVLMFDEEEYSELLQINRRCMDAIKTHRKINGSPLESINVDEQLEPLRAWYQNRTLENDFDHREILHHRLSLLGPLCHNCELPLRTPRAKRCAACGAEAINSEDAKVEI